jgi:hypothetical protein
MLRSQELRLNTHNRRLKNSSQAAVAGPEVKYKCIEGLKNSPQAYRSQDLRLNTNAEKD